MRQSTFSSKCHKLDIIYLSFNHSWTSNKRSQSNQKEELLTLLKNQILSTHFANSRSQFLSGHYWMDSSKNAMLKKKQTEREQRKTNQYRLIRESFHISSSPRVSNLWIWQHYLIPYLNRLGNVLFKNTSYKFVINNQLSTNNSKPRKKASWKLKFYNKVILIFVYT